MKKIILILMMLVAVAVFVSCKRQSTNGDNSNKVVAGSETMELIEKGVHHEVWRDKQTGREYFVRTNGAGTCGFELSCRETRN